MIEIFIHIEERGTFLKNDMKLTFKVAISILRVTLFITFLVGGIFYLEDIPIKVSLDVLITAIPTIVLYVIFRSYFKIAYYKRLKKIRTFTSIKQLPNTNDLIELEYQRILSDSLKKTADQVTELEASRRDIHDRYAIWMHNIKVPIAALQLMVENGGNIEGDKRYRMLVQINAIKSYLSEMLNLISLRNGNNDLKITKVDTNIIVRHILKRNSWMIISKNQSLQFSANLPILISDRRWLEIMLEQIIVNASKYTPNEKKIYIKSTSSKNIIIQDEGIGIDENDVKRIFETGFTGETGRDRIEATGLGLYLVGEIARKLGFSIDVASVKGQGTRFIIRQKVEE